MALWRKNSNPIDRCLDDVKHQMAMVERQVRELSVEDAARPAAQPSPSDAMGKFVKEMLKPVDGRVARTYQPKGDLFGNTAEPLKDLEATPTAFAPKGEPDLITHASCAAATASAADKTVKPAADVSKLMQYLAPGSIKSYRPPLKHVQRQTRNRFFTWMGLSCVVLWIIYVVVR